MKPENLSWRRLVKEQLATDEKTDDPTLPIYISFGDRAKLSVFFDRKDNTMLLAMDAKWFNAVNRPAYRLDPIDRFLNRPLGNECYVQLSLKEGQQAFYDALLFCQMFMVGARLLRNWSQRGFSEELEDGYRSDGTFIKAFHSLFRSVSGYDHYWSIPQIKIKKLAVLVDGQEVDPARYKETSLVIFALKLFENKNGELCSFITNVLASNQPLGVEGGAIKKL